MVTATGFLPARHLEGLPSGFIGINFSYANSLSCEMKSDCVDLELELELEKLGNVWFVCIIFPYTKVSKYPYLNVESRSHRLYVYLSVPWLKFPTNTLCSKE